MKVFSCPACGAEVKFVSAITVFAVCAHCQSMVVRRDVDVENIGKMAVLMEDLSPLQIGSGGTYNNVNFTVIGRVKVLWDDGSWNEWYLFFDDGRFGWLAEAQGFWAVSFALPNGPIPQEGIEVGALFMIHDKRFIVDDKRAATCQASEGELPFQATPNKKTVRMDLTGPAGSFASINYDDAKPELYIGQYVEFDELNFTNLRELPGWKYERAQQ